MTLTLLALTIYAPMLLEAIRAARNERAQFARGAIEPADDVYRQMQVMYPGAFAAMLLELAWRGRPSDEVIAAGAAVFAFAKALKWWAILTLGPAWTFRVLVVPRAPLVTRGPYRFLRHPNYVGVVGELVGVALMTGALVAGPTATLLFGVLLKKRRGVEDRALGRSL
ncbi:MAG TPA: isoprenylcysteine carboxylmethyltransferase family protein [Vicinamibacterales bacterium]|nr:isoprenylcysteine carboxylmethyltransferase family protein [Vicinamibacterales bacterium]